MRRQSRSLGGLHDCLDALAVGVRSQCAGSHDVLVRTIEAVRGELDGATRHCGSDAREDLEALLKSVALLAELLQKLSDLETRRTDAIPLMAEHHLSPDVLLLSSASGGF